MKGGCLVSKTNQHAAPKSLRGDAGERVCDPAFALTLAIAFVAGNQKIHTFVEVCTAQVVTGVRFTNKVECRRPNQFPHRMFSQNMAGKRIPFR
jgi:hypothetical protein